MTSGPGLYSYPPRGLSRQESARYVGVGTTKFDEMVKDGRVPKPKRVDGRMVWDRVAIDIAFTDLPDVDCGNYFDSMYEQQ
jgi:predicted DNA-binding transcriptional regulator AlpA